MVILENYHIKLGAKTTIVRDYMQDLIDRLLEGREKLHHLMVRL
jgi:hypothetical protein